MMFERGQGYLRSSSAAASAADASKFNDDVLHRCRPKRIRELDCFSILR